MISVCMTTFNGERYVREQLSSILQSPTVGEVLVADDGSTDRTRELVSGIADERVKLLDGPGAGPVRNFEFVLGRAQGSHVFLADQDDIWLPAKVERMMAALAHADLAVCDCTVVDADLHELHASFFALHRSKGGLLANLARNRFLGCCMAFRRGVLAHALPFPPKVAMHDWWLGLVAESFGSVAFIPEQLMLYRRHGGNVSSTSTRSQATLRRQLTWRVDMALALGQRRIRSRKT
jgi:glycosyltransferase involved in cell wall biosynthesis